MRDPREIDNLFGKKSADKHNVMSTVTYGMRVGGVDRSFVGVRGQAKLALSLLHIERRGTYVRTSAIGRRPDWYAERCV